MAGFQRDGVDWQCTSPLPAAEAQMRFRGRFQDREVVWDATFTTLRRYLERSAAPSARPFIEINRAADGALRLEVGLDLPEFDRPAIAKTVIMIRNYKRLRLGRHEWGELVSRA